MRIFLALPLLALAACSVDNDTGNDTMTLEYNQEQIEGTAADISNAAGEVADSVGNVAASAGQAIENEVGDIDVDVDVNRNRAGNSQ